MIERLHGMHEIIHYDYSLGLRLHHNVDSENFPQHWHMGVEIIVPTEGGYEVVTEDGACYLKPQDVIIIHSGVIHALKAPEKGERFILQFDSGLLSYLKEMETLLFMLPPVIWLKAEEKSPLYCLVREKLDRIIEEYQGKGSFRESSIYASIIEIYVELGRNEVYKSKRAKQAHTTKQQEYLEAVMSGCAYVNQHYMENLTLEEVAQISGFSKYHFTRIFKQYMNMTFYEYLNSRRIRRAEELLYNTEELRVTDVAMGAGFSSMSAFNRTFQNFKHCSPSDYRKMKKGGGLERKEQEEQKAQYLHD